MKIRVLICRSNPIAPDPRVEKIARALASAGENFRSAQQDGERYPDGYAVSILGWDRTGELSTADLLPTSGEPIPLFRLPVRGAFGHGLQNLPSLLRWQAGLLRWLVQHRQEYDLIHACDFDTILPALYCKRWWGKSVIYDIFDFYADHLRATPNILKQLIRWVDLRAISWADALILADETRYEQIAGARPKRSAVIYNSPEEIRPNNSTASVAKQDETGVLPDRQKSDSQGLRLVYVGLLQVERGLIEMISILQRHPEWILDLAGFGGDEQRLHQLVCAMPNVVWHGRVSYQRALQLSQAADVLFATYDPAIPNHRYSSPNKVFEAMLLGKPIIVARNTNMDRMIEQLECGLVIDYGDLSALEGALVKLQTDPDFRLRLGANARHAYETTYSWSKMEERLLAIYAQVVAGNSQRIDSSLSKKQ